MRLPACRARAWLRSAAAGRSATSWADARIPPAQLVWSKSMSKKATIFVQQVRSARGRTQDQHATLRGLGLRKLNRVRELEDTPAVRDMINKVAHLVKVVD